MQQSSIPTAQILVQYCKSYDLSNVVISPGSRNAPLTLSFTEDPFFRCYSIVDERSAAFFALGLAQQSDVPVVAVCTSGSALLNYYPAVAEAFYSCIPLVLISADRPNYKIDIGDGQTIRQDNVFERHIGYSANLLQDVVHATDRIEKYVPQWIGEDDLIEVQKKVTATNRAELTAALNIAVKEKQPVHINVPFEEPLYDLVEVEQEKQNIASEKVESKGAFDFTSFTPIWNQARRKLVLVGTNPPNAVDQRFLDTLAQDPSVIVMTETTSNLHHSNFFPSIDSIVAPIEVSADKDELFKALQPDLLLTFGGLIVSKKIKAFLRTYRPKHHWHIGLGKANNTFFVLSEHLKMDPCTFFESFLPGVQRTASDYFEFWASRKKYYESKRTRYLRQIPFSDMLAFDTIIKSIPENYQLQLANSSTVRYAQLFDLDPSLKVFCNRGTSGIDGSVSTAVGASINDSSPTLLITGDLSFLYDSNGLWNNYLRSDFKVIVINNNGGGIFRILPGYRETENFKSFFETPHSLNLAHLSDFYGMEYSKASDKEELKERLRDFYEPSEGPKLLEVITPSEVNDRILLRYFDFIS